MAGSTAADIRKLIADRKAGAAKKAPARKATGATKKATATKAAAQKSKPTKKTATKKAAAAKPKPKKAATKKTATKKAAAPKPKPTKAAPKKKAVAKKAPAKKTASGKKPPAPAPAPKADNSTKGAPVASNPLDPTAIANAFATVQAERDAAEAEATQKRMKAAAAAFYDVMEGNSPTTSDGDTDTPASKKGDIIVINEEGEEKTVTKDDYDEIKDDVARFIPATGKVVLPDGTRMKKSDFLRDPEGYLGTTPAATRGMGSGFKKAWDKLMGPATK